MQPQIIRNLQGDEEFCVLPITVYERLKDKINLELELLASASSDSFSDEDNSPTSSDSVISNPVTMMRLRAGIKQKDLAEQLGVTQAYVSKIENSDSVSPRFVARVRTAIQARAIEKARLG